MSLHPLTSTPLPHTLVDTHSTMATTYKGFKSSIASLRVAGAHSPSSKNVDNPKAAVVSTELPASPPDSDASSDVDSAHKTAGDGVAFAGLKEEKTESWTIDWNGGFKFAPIKEHIVSRGEWSGIVLVHDVNARACDASSEG